MNFPVLGFLVALCAVCSCEEKITPPKVQFYSSHPGEFGLKNTLICHVTNFHPPNLKILILKDDVEIPGFNQTDLAFKADWHFHLTKSVDFTPRKGEQYTCKVVHGTKDNTYLWEPNM